MHCKTIAKLSSAISSHASQAVVRPRARQSRNAVLAYNRSSSFIATSEQATAELSALIAEQRLAGDCICLNGGVGAGKSAFRYIRFLLRLFRASLQSSCFILTCTAACSRAYIRYVGEDDSMPVPSPTYLLQNIYEYMHGKTS